MLRSIVERSLEVAAPAGRVWQAVLDYEARPRWAPRVKLDSSTRGRSASGPRVRLRIDRDRFTATVVELQPTERPSVRVKGPGFLVHHGYVVRGVGDRTSVTLAAEYRGIVGRLAARFMRRSVEGDLADELAAIEAASEANSAE